MYPPPRSQADAAEPQDGTGEEENVDDDLLFVETADENENVEEENSEGEDPANAEQGQAAGEEIEIAEDAAPTQRRKKKDRVVRPINKHHHILHYVELIKKWGPTALYWCMRWVCFHAL